MNECLTVAQENQTPIGRNPLIKLASNSIPSLQHDAKEQQKDAQLEHETPNVHKLLIWGRKRCLQIHDLQKYNSYLWNVEHKVWKAVQAPAALESNKSFLMDRWTGMAQNQFKQQDKYHQSQYQKSTITKWLNTYASAKRLVLNG